MQAPARGGGKERRARPLGHGPEGRGGDVAESVRLVRVGGHEVIGGLVDGKRVLRLSRPHVPDARQGQRPVCEIAIDRAVGRENKGIIVRRGGLPGHFVVVDMRIQILQHLIRPFPGKMLRSPRGRR